MFIFPHWFRSLVLAGSGFDCGHKAWGISAILGKVPFHCSLMYKVVGQVQSYFSEGSKRTELAGRVGIKTACSSTALCIHSDFKNHIVCTPLQDPLQRSQRAHSHTVVVSSCPQSPAKQVEVTCQRWWSLPCSRGHGLSSILSTPHCLLKCWRIVQLQLSLKTFP